MPIIDSPIIDSQVHAYEANTPKSLTRKSGRLVTL